MRYEPTCKNIMVGWQESSTMYPKVFSPKYLEVTKPLSILNKTAEGYITEFHKKGLIHREQHDYYRTLYF